MQKILDIFENHSFSVEESGGDINGSAILGKVKGVFFVPDGVSRNNRKYPKELWEKVCNNPNVRKRLEERRMFGTIGHEQKLGDSAVLDGKISHIITNIGIFNGQGIGEALIIDTPAGRILNTLLRAGSKIFVSSRADGSYKGEDKGIPIVDPDTYQIEGWDFVLDPGFLQANPSLVEKFDQILAGSTATQNNEGDFEMEAKLIESMAKENAAYKAELERATTEIETLKANKAAMQSENSHFRIKLDKQQKAESLVRKYEALGTPEQIEKVLDISEAKLGKWKELGSYNEVYRALDKAEKKIKQIEFFLKEYRNLGSVKELSEALDKSIQVVNAYKQLGKPSDINKSFDVVEKLILKTRQDKSKLRISELAKELKVSEDKIKTVYGRISENDIKKLFSGRDTTTNNGPASKFVKRGSQSANESKLNSKPSFSSKKLGSRLMESFSGPLEK